MRILKKNKIAGDEFKVLRPHFYGAPHAKPGEWRVVQPGEVLPYVEPEASGLAEYGKIAPMLPEVGSYLSIRGFSLQKDGQTFDAQPPEVVELLAEDALKLLIKGDIIPVDEEQWRPRNRRLKDNPRNTRSAFPKGGKTQ